MQACWASGGGGLLGGWRELKKEHLLGQPLTQAAGVYCDELRPDLHERRKVLTDAMEGIGWRVVWFCINAMVLSVQVDKHTCKQKTQSDRRTTHTHTHTHTQTHAHTHARTDMQKQHQIREVDLHRLLRPSHKRRCRAPKSAREALLAAPCHSNWPDPTSNEGPSFESQVSTQAHHIRASVCRLLEGFLTRLSMLRVLRHN